MRTRPAGGGRGAKHANAQMQGPPDPGKSMIRVTVYKAVGNGKPCLEQGKAEMVSPQRYRVPAMRLARYCCRPCCCCSRGSSRMPVRRTLHARTSC